MTALKALLLGLAYLAAASLAPQAHAGPLIRDPGPSRNPVTAGTSNFTWTTGADVSVPLLNTEDADAGVIQVGATLWVETSLSPGWFRFAGTTLDNLVAQPNAVLDPTTFNRPNGDDAYWTDSIWQDPSGTWHAIIHIEYDYATTPHTAFLWKRRIGVATSTDQGANWTYSGDIITPNSNRAVLTTVMGAPSPTASFQDFGCGDTYMFVDRRGGYFYLYYLTAWVYSSTGWRTNEVMSVARCAISDAMAPGKWYKWSSGAWTQPGLGGAEDAVFDGTAAVANAPFVGTDMSVVHFNTYLNAFVAIGHDSNSQAWISTCSDITKQQWTAGDYTFPQDLYWYNWPVDPVTHDPYEIGQNFRLYSSQANTNQVASKYFPITLSNGDVAPTARLAAPAEGSVAFTGNSLSLVAAATAPDGSVAKVEFFANQVELGTVTTPPYTYVWPNVATGQYRCWVRVTDNLGVATDSAGVDVTVTPITYPLWKAANGIPTAALDTVAQANGLSPLLSYGLNVSSVAGLPQPKVSAGNLTLTYSAPRSDVSYLVQSSTDLVNWSSNLVNQGTPSLLNPVTASIPLSDKSKGSLFLRLEITYP